jgi:peptidoglycan hydrolase-like protein with peptidoglycan-binding domain
MGKSRASLLAIVFQLFLATTVFADEGVRAIQEQLRKRHLFHGDITGETTPALTAAIRRYQELKGFPRTGLIDSETASSLGVTGHAFPTVTPFVLDTQGGIRGANGEALPASLASHWSADEGSAQIEQEEANSDPLPVAATRTESENASRNKGAVKRSSPARTRLNRPRKDTNPFQGAWSTIDHAKKFLFGDVGAKKKRRPGKQL